MVNRSRDVMDKRLPNGDFYGFSLPSAKFNRILSSLAFILGNGYILFNHSSIETDRLIEYLVIINVLPLVLWYFGLAYFDHNDPYDDE